MELGDIICDMHDGPSNNITVCSHCSVETESAFELLTLLCESIGVRTPHNKLAVCVGETMQADVYKAAYSYDGRRFGLFTFKVKE
jgi:hypothetical protein